ncbi:uncharacterized protein LOC132312158 isoform X2 [Cornus florida]|uniref:uncharacterized protein LOC132312158 isoform X2 n=1 Tax=Cornus florida TaxID=4283 RepID=UPI00289F0A9B|nr:uncharacterized protein LOC132312158 isoform X2 [Cornus florida]
MVWYAGMAFLQDQLRRLCRWSDRMGSCVRSLRVLHGGQPNGRSPPIFPFDPGFGEFTVALSISACHCSGLLFRIWAVTATTNPGLSVMPPQVCLLGSKRFTETSGIGKNIGT